MSVSEHISERVDLAPLTTLGVGGPARRFARATDEAQLSGLLELARAEGWPLRVLGEGSNVVIHDRGIDALVIQLADDRLDGGEDGSIRVGGGHRWDALVRWSVERDLAGIECLSGIPGFVGAAPIQNIGAYGQELAETVERVHAVHAHTGERRDFAAPECGFSYRDSFFKRSAGWIVTAVTLRLRPGGAPTLRYAELQRAVEPGASLSTVREAVLTIRRSKGMVLDPEDPDSRSAGSFFTNPMVDRREFEALCARLSQKPEQIPHWEAGDQLKLSAAWLIEQSGWKKGAALGAARLSRKHVLALVNDGAATAAELVELARRIQRDVAERSGIALVPEPRFWGFTPDELGSLNG